MVSAANRRQMVASSTVVATPRTTSVYFLNPESSTFLRSIPMKRHLFGRMMQVLMMFLWMTELCVMKVLPVVPPDANSLLSPVTVMHLEGVGVVCCMLVIFIVFLSFGWNILGFVGLGVGVVFCLFCLVLSGVVKS